MIYDLSWVQRVNNSYICISIWALQRVVFKFWIFSAARSAGGETGIVWLTTNKSCSSWDLVMGHSTEIFEYLLVQAAAGTPACLEKSLFLKIKINSTLYEEVLFDWIMLMMVSRSGLERRVRTHYKLRVSILVIAAYSAQPGSVWTVLLSSITQMICSHYQGYPNLEQQQPVINNTSDDLLLFAGKWTALLQHNSRIEIF